MYRQIQKLIGDTAQPSESFENLRKGDRFLLFEDDGALLGRFEATSDVEPCEPIGNFAVQCEPV